MTEIQAGTCHATCHPESPSTTVQRERQSNERQTPDHSAKTERRAPDYNVDTDTLLLYWYMRYMYIVTAVRCFICMQLSCKHFGNENAQIFVMPIKHLKTEYWETTTTTHRETEIEKERDLFMLGDSRGSLKRRDQSQCNRRAIEGLREKVIVFTGYVRLLLLLAVVNWIIFSSLLAYVNSCVAAAAAGL